MDKVLTAGAADSASIRHESSSAVSSAPALNQNKQLARCDEALGTISLQEDAQAPWSSQARERQLGSTLPVLKLMIQQSNCFVVVERGGTSATLERERALMQSGESRSGSYFGKGQLVAADYTLSPEILFSGKAGTGSGGLGLLAAVAASAAKNDASTTLMLVDNRSGVKISAAEGTAANFDLGADGFRFLGNSALSGGAYAKTPQGKVVVAAFADSYNQVVKALRNYKDQSAKGGLGTGGRLGVQGGSTAAPKANQAPATLRPYVNLEAPPSVRPRQRVAVQVWLSQQLKTPEVNVVPAQGEKLDPQGRLVLLLPAEQKTWEIDIALSAPGFDFEPNSPNGATLQLTSDGSSDPAGFFLVARDGISGPQTLSARLWHKGAYLGSVNRTILIESDPITGETRQSPGQKSSEISVPVASGRLAEGKPLPGPVTSFQPATRRTFAAPFPTDDRALPASSKKLPADQPVTADLTIHLSHDDSTTLAGVEVVMSSPYFRGLRKENHQYSRDTAEWLESWIDRLQRLQASMRESPVALDNVDVLRGLGAELYQRLAPREFKDALAVVLALQPGRPLTIQVYSNNPSIPWELMRPGKIGGRDVDFLGTEFHIARWPSEPGGAVTEVPRQTIRLKEVVVVAPRYSGKERLPAQDEEVSYLSRWNGFRRVDATTSGVRQVAANPPDGIFHFAGHGEATGATAAQRRYQLQLEDSRFDAVAWRGVRGRPSSTGSLYFFNACNLGSTESQAGFIGGWAPVLLEGGASGFIGGLWSLPDGPASQFALRFYDAMREQTLAQPRRRVAEALRQARALFFETGNPAFLAYAYYGDVNLELVNGSTATDTRGPR